MSVEKEDGGPAFPQADVDVDGEGGASMETKGGMSLRDYFAAAAITGLFNSGIIHEDAPRMAFAIADEMLKARKP